MELMTAALKKRFSEVGNQDGRDLDTIVIAKYFDPGGSWTWYATEYFPTEQKFFGYVRGFEDEWGYFNLDELQSVRNRWGLSLERDLYFEEQPLRKVLEEQGDVPT